MGLRLGRRTDRRLGFTSRSSSAPFAVSRAVPPASPLCQGLHKGAGGAYRGWGHDVDNSTDVCTVDALRLLQRQLHDARLGPLGYAYLCTAPASGVAGVLVSRTAAVASVRACGIAVVVGAVLAVLSCDSHGGYDARWRLRFIDGDGDWYSLDSSVKNSRGDTAVYAGPVAAVVHLYVRLSAEAAEQVGVHPATSAVGFLYGGCGYL